MDIEDDGPASSISMMMTMMIKRHSLKFSTWCTFVPISLAYVGFYWFFLQTVLHNFYPFDAMLARVCDRNVSVCPPVHHAPVWCQNEES